MAWCVTRSVRKTVVEITPEGYLMSKRCFKTLPELFKWFKLNAQQLGRSSRSGRKVIFARRQSGGVFVTAPIHVCFWAMQCFAFLRFSLK